MDIKSLDELLNVKNKVQIKIYSLVYTIEKSDTKYIIYSNLYSYDKKTYNSLNELLNNYTIYNESIMDNISKVSIVK